MPQLRWMFGPLIDLPRPSKWARLPVTLAEHRRLRRVEHADLVSGDDDRLLAGEVRLRLHQPGVLFDHQFGENFRSWRIHACSGKGDLVLRVAPSTRKCWGDGRSPDVAGRGGPASEAGPAAGCGAAEPAGTGSQSVAG